MKGSVALLAFALLLPTLVSHAQNPKMTPAQRAKFVSEAKEAITKDLLDPGAAQFRKLHVAIGGPDPALCGEINTKNRMGAYTGFKLFYVILRDGKYSGDIKVSDEPSAVWEMLMLGYCSTGITQVK